MVLTNDEAINIIRLNQKTPDWVTKAREDSKVWKALINGDNFHDLLIQEIEKIESSQRAMARKKYSRDIKDLFGRISEPIQNIFSAPGGSEKIEIENDDKKNEFVQKIQNFSANKSIADYLSQTWIELLHTDPSGVVFLEYKSNSDENSLWPTYKSTSNIRNYKSDGQLVDWILFEPKKSDDGNIMFYRIVDDARDIIISQVGESMLVVEDKTFDHPFGRVPCIINSPIEKVGEKYRLTPFDKILAISKEYSRDQSIKTLYKFSKGFPIFWRYVSQCSQCNGTKKTGETKSKCKACDGRGFMQKGDVTDEVTLPTPKSDQPVLAPNIAGYISPDTDTWNQYNSELEILEDLMTMTIWGTSKDRNKSGRETATGRFIDIQPLTNKLDWYSTLTQYMDNQLGHWVDNFFDISKTDKDQVRYVQVYGRRYIIEPPDVILTRYEDAKEKGDNSTILDRLLGEYIMSAYKNDPIQRNIMLKKASVEPYVHLSVESVDSLFGQLEAQKKVMFSRWWMNVADKTKTVEELIKDFNTWFNDDENFPQQQSNS